MLLIFSVWDRHFVSKTPNQARRALTREGAAAAPHYEFSEAAPGDASTHYNGGQQTPDELPTT